MPLTDELRSRLDSTIASNKIVLFMKGNPQHPQCGFSATVIGILNNVAPDYDTVDVLADPEIREGIKEYSQWPTIPQLYVDQEFLGGCDVIQQMYTTGQLHEALGVEPVELVTPEITISDTAARAIRNVMAETPGVPVHLSVDADWNHEFSLAPAKGHEVGVTANGIELLLDVDSARRANGLVIDMTETPQGMSMSIKNPNAPAPAAQMSVEELKAKMDAGEPLHLFDVREKDE
ncbi:MAG: Grx4 family monothiol glutaredoxin, partial [Proteobacteria bacterium]|nr:Grx4 family monothiol glutaredoxin [Pseudomonadota bacterium]